MRDSVLAEHGAGPSGLKPSSIVHAARRDLATRDRGVKGAQGRRYLFAWLHVRHATGPFDLIKRALEEPSIGAGTEDLNTREIYRNPDLLRAALALEPRAT